MIEEIKHLYPNCGSDKLKCNGFTIGGKQKCKCKEWALPQLQPAAVHIHMNVNRPVGGLSLAQAVHAGPEIVAANAAKGAPDHRVSAHQGCHERLVCCNAGIRCTSRCNLVTRLTVNVRLPKISLSWCIRWGQH